MKCSICLEDIEITEQYITECKHEFCCNCIETWLKSHSSCPMCRREISNSLFQRTPLDDLLDKLEEIRRGLDRLLDRMRGER